MIILPSTKYNYILKIALIQVLRRGDYNIIVYIFYTAALNQSFLLLFITYLLIIILVLPLLFVSNNNIAGHRRNRISIQNVPK